MSNATSGDGSPSQSPHELTLPFSSVQSVLSDLAAKVEVTDFDGDGEQLQRRRHNEDIHVMRISHTRLLLGLALVWIFVILTVVLLQGFGQWFTPVARGLIHLSFQLSDGVVIAFITSTTATVLGLYGIAAYWLYGNAKRDEKMAVTSMEA